MRQLPRYRGYLAEVGEAIRRDEQFVDIPWFIKLVTLIIVTINALKTLHSG
jgi:hypothetical protein